MDVLHKPFPYTTCQMRGHVNHEITLICETKQNEKASPVRPNQIGNPRKGNTPPVNQKSVIFEKGNYSTRTCVDLMNNAVAT